MYRRPTKKQMLIRRIIVSTVMTLSVLVILTGTILFVLGYRLDGTRGRLEQGAILQFDSVPSGALISLDGVSTGVRTPNKQSVIAGLHSFTMTRDGYQPWAKSLDLKAGTLTWLDYVRLVPTDLTPETVGTYKTLAGEKASPDLRTLIVLERADTPTFRLVDLRSQTVKSSFISLPTDTYSEAGTAGVTHNFTLERWDEGSRHVLVKHIYDKKTEWIVLDTQDVGSSVNVTRLLSISLRDARFSGTSGNILYALTEDGVIRKLDLASETISRGLVTNVKSFDLFETNIITYVGLDPSDTKRQVAGVYREGDESPHVLRTVASAQTPLHIDATRYFSDDYVAIAEGLKVTVLKGRYPASSQDDADSLRTVAELTADADVDRLSFSPDGDYLVVQSGLRFFSYEVEYQRRTDAVIDTSETKAHALQWLDEAYLWAVYDGHVAIREFDGTNVHVINAAEPGMDVTLSQNGRYLYSITKEDGTYQLQRVRMILD